MAPSGSLNFRLEEPLSDARGDASKPNFADSADFDDFDEVLWHLERRSHDENFSLTDVELSHCQKIADLSAANSVRVGYEDVKNIWVPVFERLSTLHPEILECILEKFSSHNLFFAKVGNILASNNHQWLLSTFSGKMKKTTNSNSNELYAKEKQKRAVELKSNVLAILNYLVESLKLEKAPSCNSESHLTGEDTDCLPDFSYLSKLLKVSSELDSEVSKSVLMKHMSKNLPKLLLKDLQILEWKTVQNLFIRYSAIMEETEKSTNVTFVTSLADDYISWKTCQDGELVFNDFVLLVESFPKEARVNCDKLYDVINRFLKKNPDISETDRLHLCEFLDPFKLSEAKVEDAVRNQDIILHPSFFTALYSSQKRQITDMRSRQDQVSFVFMILFSISIILSLYILFLIHFAPAPKPTSRFVKSIVSEMMKENKFSSVKETPTLQNIVSEVVKKTKCPSIEEIVSEVKKSLPPPPNLQTLLNDATGSTAKSLKYKLAGTLRYLEERLTGD